MKAEKEIKDRIEMCKVIVKYGIEKYRDNKVYSRYYRLPYCKEAIDDGAVSEQMLQERIIEKILHEPFVLSNTLDEFVPITNWIRMMKRSIEKEINTSRKGFVSFLFHQEYRKKLKGDLQIYEMFEKIVYSRVYQLEEILKDKTKE